MKQFLFFTLLTSTSLLCMEPPKSPRKPDVKPEANAYKVALPHGGTIFFCDWPGSAPIAYALILRERERQSTLPIRYDEETYPHMP